VLSRSLRILQKGYIRRDCILINCYTYRIARSRFSDASRRQLFGRHCVSYGVIGN